MDPIKAFADWLVFNIREAVRELGIDADILKVQDFAEIAKRGVMMTPALVVNGKVQFTGKAPSSGEIKKLLEK